VASAAEIVRQPLAFMMEEPLGALDSEFRELMCQECARCHDGARHHRLVKHDQDGAMALADKIAIRTRA